MSDLPQQAPETGATPVRQTPRARRRLETVREQRDLRRRLVAWGLTIGLVVLLVNAVVGENGYLATLHARQEKSGLEAEVAHLRIENQRLQEEMKGLLEDPAVLEEAARAGLGLKREGEAVIILKNVAPDAHPPSPPVK